VHEFSYNATIAKEVVALLPAKPKSSVVPATQHTRTCQRKNTRVLMGLRMPCITLYKRTLLGLEMVEIGAPQGKTAPESKLSYPATHQLICMWWTWGSTVLARLPLFLEEIASSKRDLTKACRDTM